MVGGKSEVWSETKQGRRDLYGHCEDWQHESHAKWAHVVMSVWHQMVSKAGTMRPLGGLMADYYHTAQSQARGIESESGA